MTLGLLACSIPRQIASESVNGCDPTTAKDYSEQRDVEIRFGDDHAYQYIPKCIKVSPGTRIHFRGNLAAHPLASGRFASGRYEEENGSPLRLTEVGEETSFVFNEPGAFGFLCYIHAVNGMVGAVFVE